MTGSWRMLMRVSTSVWSVPVHCTSLFISHCAALRHYQRPRSVGIQHSEAAEYDGAGCTCLQLVPPLLCVTCSVRSGG